MTRIAPLDPPYSEKTRELFDLVMPPGVEPLVLFRVLARSGRLLPRFMRAGVLDEGPVPARDREVVIHRTTARCGAEYEWGVHVAAFGRPLGLSDELLRATVEADAESPSLAPRQAVLFRLCDELHDGADVSDATWQALRAHFDELQILELIYTAGLYHAVSFLVKALRLPPEPFAARFEDFSSGSPRASG